jgi:glycosyltransferase involved in cell wall biosynthesis
MQILFVIGSLELGGAERHVAHVSRHLKIRGWKPEVFVLTPGGPLTKFLQESNVPIKGYSLPNWFARLVKSDRLRTRIELLLSIPVLLGTIWIRRPVVLHFFLPGAYIIGGITSLFSRVPVRIMSRRSLRNYQATKPFLARIEKFLHPKMTLVCGNSKAVMSELLEEDISAQCLRLIYNGIDFEPYTKPFDRSTSRMNAGVPENALVFVLVANLIPYKGHSDLIKALAKIRADLPDPWLLLCLGRDDGIGPDLREEADSLGVGSHIRFLGSRTDVPVFLRLADIGLLCSHEEGFSNALLEGMAAGLPMVVTDVGGNAEAVLDTITGFVVPAHNPERLAEALLKISRADDRAAMGASGRRRAEKHFSMVACIDAYEALYREANSDLR